MKILLLCNSVGGLISFRQELLEALHQKEYDVVVSAPKGDKKEALLADYGCRLIPTKISRRGINPVTDFSLIMKYRQMLKAEHPDVILSYTIKPNLYGGLVCQWYHTPQIVNVTGLGTAVENPGILQKFIILLYKICLRKCRVMFFQNNANRMFCQKHGMIHGRNELLPGSGVNLQRFTATPMPNDEKVRFIFISRVMRQKGIEEYLGMAERIKKEYPNTEFHILGSCEDGNYEVRLKQLQKEDVVIYDGMTVDVRPYIQNVHCTVHPSFYPEGMSNVLLESCASGRAIITTNRPGCGEIVEDGVNGYICRQQDVDDLTEKVKKFLSLSHEERQKMGNAARKKVERKFDRQIVVDKYLKEIENIKV